MGWGGPGHVRVGWGACVWAGACACGPGHVVGGLERVRDEWHTVKGLCRLTHVEHKRGGGHVQRVNATPGELWWHRGVGNRKEREQGGQHRQGRWRERGRRHE